MATSDGIAPQGTPHFPRDLRDMTGTLDEGHMCGGFTRPPIVLAPTATQEELIAVAASRAQALFELVDFMLGDQREERSANDAAALFYGPAADLAHITNTLASWRRLRLNEAGGG